MKGPPFGRIGRIGQSADYADRKDSADSSLRLRSGQASLRSLGMTADDKPQSLKYPNSALPIQPLADPPADGGQARAARKEHTARTSRSFAALRMTAMGLERTGARGGQKSRAKVLARPE
ncbi:MAG: hypothetical protein A3F68_01480 [Acidobacteria bacterium RIFCSPLOWO2_12_FULL_54_10]|nr:MAG: hypothetical protein A3F68_01480 [Acidobacteria bacterium RIFCSPLOWO2_12_FULL_54_10]